MHLAGDIGYYDEDGCLFIVDRLKQMIKCMDKQVAPAELENILIKHPDVKEVVVVGVPHIEYGEAARAFVVLSDHDLDGKMTEMELRKLVEGEPCAITFFPLLLFQLTCSLRCGVLLFSFSQK